jgi:hypothetical protein
MAHEYFPKVPVEVVMFGRLARPLPRVAIVTRASGYVFVVEAYLAHFMRAARRVETALLTLPKPTIPPPD